MSVLLISIQDVYSDVNFKHIFYSVLQKELYTHYTMSLITTVKCDLLNN